MDIDGPKQFICGRDEFYFFKGYIALALPQIPGLPDTMDVRGDVLLKKPDLHVSLVCVKDIADKYSDKSPDVAGQVLALFCEYLQSEEVRFVRYVGKFRVAMLGEKKTLVGMCEVDGLREFFRTMRDKLAVDIPDQPTHVTLYTLQPNAGIGLTSQQMVADLSADVSSDLDRQFVENFQ